MASKRVGDPSYDKAELDEPIFVLRAQDRCAPGAVRDWAARAKVQGASPEKVQGALDTAADMEAWQKIHGAKVPD